MSATLIDGKSHAARLRAALAEEVGVMTADGLQPGLAVVLVGNDPASEIYVRSKTRLTNEVGMHSAGYILPATIRQDELLALIDSLNRDDEIDGILIQLPLPPHIDAETVIEAIDPMKDVDGFHPINAGRLATTGGGPVPCTPRGSLMLLKSVRQDLTGLNAVVVGRSSIVGKPMAQLLLCEGCTVTIAHSKTRDLPEVLSRGDIVVAAVGKPEFVRGAWLKPGSLIIDVGINRVTGPSGKTAIVGDVAFDEAVECAGAITPVPGGVGPMTIACLLNNTVDAARRRRGARR